MFEGEGDKKKKVYPACSIVGQEGYTIMYSHSILCYEKHCLPHDYGELLRKQLPQFNLNMTGISTEPATTLPSPSGTKRGISLTTLKASLSNRGSSLVFTAPEGETTVPEASKAIVAVTVADAEGEPFTVSQEDTPYIYMVILTVC